MPIRRKPTSPICRSASARLVVIDTFPDHDVLRHGRLGQPRHRRAIRDPAAAERQRQLGQGGAARAAPRPARQGPDAEQAARRHERLCRDRHRQAPLVRRFGRNQASSGLNMIRLAAGMSPSARRAMLTVCAMTATIMQALDTTVANVALPYMQGSLSASLDQINWVLTSYIVASAIMTAPIGWMSDRFGRKRLFIICSAGFTFASLLCAGVPGHRLDGVRAPDARRVRRRAGAAVAIGDARRLPARQARPGHGDLGHGRDARPDHGPDARRLPHRSLLLALGVPDQPAGRHRHGARPDAVHGRDQEADPPALRLVRLHRARRRHRLAATAARPRRAGRLVRRQRDHRRDRSSRSPASISSWPIR